MNDTATRCGACEDHRQRTEEPMRRKITDWLAPVVLRHVPVDAFDIGRADK